MLNYLAVGFGGALGSMLRYMLAIWIPSSSTGFPYATFTANLFACLILGALAGGTGKLGLSDTTQLMLGTGFCGGFSTFSTFSKESVTLLQETFWLGFLYISLSLIVGLLLFVLGWWLAEQT